MKIYLLLILIPFLICTTYKKHNYKEILSAFTSLSHSNSNFLKLFDAVTILNLDKDNSCGETPCFQPVVLLTNFSTLVPNRPQV